MGVHELCLLVEFQKKSTEQILRHISPDLHVYIRHGTRSSGHRVNGSFWVIFHVRVTRSPGHHFDPARPEFFRFSKKCTKCKTYIGNAEMTKSHCRLSVVGLKSLDVSPCNELLLLPMIIKFFGPPLHKPTFGVHYRTGSPGQLGLRVAGFPHHWVAGSQNATQFHVWSALAYRSSDSKSHLSPNLAVTIFASFAVSVHIPRHQNVMRLIYIEPG